VYNAEERLYLYDNIPSITLLGETDFSNVQPSFGFHLDNMGFTKAVKVADDQLLLVPRPYLAIDADCAVHLAGEVAIIKPGMRNHPGFVNLQQKEGTVQRHR
jgi:hypothetical protein